MNIKLLIQDNNTGIINDVSELVGDITMETHLTGQPGKLEFKFIKPDQNTAFFYEGGVVTLRDLESDTGIFYGYIFKKTRTRDQIITVTCYDQLRYLKNQDTLSFLGMTCSDIFESICDSYGLTYLSVDKSDFVIADTTHDNIALASMIEDAFDKTIAYTGRRFILRDNFGTLEHVALRRLLTTLIIGDAASLTNYSYETSIDADVYNQIKIVQDNKKTAKRDVYMVLDSFTVNKWGILQYHEKIDESANAAQIEARAENLLKLYNVLSRTLSLSCLGDFRIGAGSGVMLAIKDLGDIHLNQYCIVQSCRRTIRNDLHTMELKVNIWLEQN